MYSPLVPITIQSIYPKHSPGPLPKHLAVCPPDVKKALLTLVDEVKQTGGRLVLSDLFRSHDQQLQAHLDYTSGKKKAYSPPPGRSFHEAGRAFDLVLEQLGTLGATGDRLTKFHPMAAHHGVTPIIEQPNSNLSEAWHFERRGSHQRVYDYYSQGNGTNFSKPAWAAAASAIVSLGFKVEALGDDPMPAYIQSGLIRLGQNIGNLDGKIGPKTRTALSNLNIVAIGLDEIAAQVELLLMGKYPEEYFIATVEETL